MRADRSRCIPASRGSRSAPPRSTAARGHAWRARRPAGNASRARRARCSRSPGTCAARRRARCRRAAGCRGSCSARTRRRDGPPARAARRRAFRSVRIRRSARRTSSVNSLTHSSFTARRSASSRSASRSSTVRSCRRSSGRDKNLAAPSRSEFGRRTSSGSRLVGRAGRSPVGQVRRWTIARKKSITALVSLGVHGALGMHRELGASAGLLGRGGLTDMLGNSSDIATAAISTALLVAFMPPSIPTAGRSRSPRLR